MRKATAEPWSEGYQAQVPSLPSQTGRTARQEVLEDSQEKDCAVSRSVREAMSTEFLPLTARATHARSFIVSASHGVERRPPSTQHL